MATHYVDASEKVFTREEYDVKLKKTAWHRGIAFSLVRVAEMGKAVKDISVPFSQYYTIRHTLDYLGDTWLIRDAEKKLISQTLNRTLVVAETYWDNIAYILRALETVKAADGSTKQIRKKTPETVRIADRITKKIGKKLIDTLLVVDLYIRAASLTLAFAEMLHASDKTTKKIGVNRQYTLELLDAIDKGMLFYLTLLDKILASDETIKHVWKSLEDDAGLKDRFIKTLTRRAGDALTILDGLCRDVQITRKDSVRIRDAFQRVARLLRNIREYAFLDEAVKRKTRYKRGFSDGYTVFDDAEKQISHLIDENVLTADKFSKNVVFQRMVIELAACGDALMKEYDLQAEENAEIYEAYIRAANAVLEAVRVSEDALDADDFLNNLNQVPGYEAFTDFNVGEYEYEKALIRIQVISNATHSQPLLYDVAVDVDIDDTDDRGSLYITDTTGSTKVYFNKFYYNPPEVVATLVGATGDAVIVPYIVSTEGKDDTGRYFEIELLDETGTLVAGAVSWAAKGW